MYRFDISLYIGLVRDNYHISKVMLSAFFLYFNMMLHKYFVVAIEEIRIVGELATLTFREIDISLCISENI